LSDLLVSKVETVETKNNYGRFCIEPLEKGFSVTLGNALRRILLGFLEGAAVTRVKIEGIQHEFSTIPHVKEDTTEFLMNIKALRLKPLSGQAGKLTLDVEGEKRVTAADIGPSADFEIANPDLYLAYLDSAEARMNVEFDVELARGYREAESSGNLPVGVIPVDAIFTPIRKVNFTIEAVHVGQETSHERLLLEVWTDGTLTPSEAVSRAAALLTEQLSPLVALSHIVLTQGEKEPTMPSIAPELASIPVEQLNLSVRTLNCLRRGNINTLGELMSKSEKDLMSLRNFGIKSKQELEERLKSLGLSMPLLS
jgi:DNA-directed RNA polymerase subunit alpha